MSDRLDEVERWITLIEGDTSRGVNYLAQALREIVAELRKLRSMQVAQEAIGGTMTLPPVLPLGGTKHFHSDRQE